MDHDLPVLTGQGPLLEDKVFQPHRKRPLSLTDFNSVIFHLHRQVARARSAAADHAVLLSGPRRSSSAFGLNTFSLEVLPLRARTIASSSARSCAVLQHFAK